MSDAVAVCIEFIDPQLEKVGPIHLTLWKPEATAVRVVEALREGRIKVSATVSEEREIA